MPQRREQTILANSEPLPSTLESAVKIFLIRLASARGYHGRDSLRSMGMGVYPNMGKDLDHLDGLSNDARRGG